jgi:hypothetical protein
MKPLFTLLLLLVTFQSRSQTDWWCVLPGVKNYYINKSCYLRGTRIDSVKTIGNATILYPFKSPRGYYLNGEKLKSSGSWVGETITILPDGTHYFDNFWGDTVVIKTHAVLNDTWTLFDDTSDIYYTATLSAVDTMTVVGVVDSIKEITIHAFNSGGTFTADPLHNAKLILSKSHGFVQAVDMFMFPLHEPNKGYKDGFDYFLKKTIVGNPTLSNGLLFRLVNFYNPDMLEVYGFDIGDRFSSSRNMGGWPYPSLRQSVVVNKITINSTEIEYALSNASSSYIPPQGAYVTSYSTSPLKITSAKLFDTVTMPEEWGVELFYRYMPNDTSFCSKTPLYTIESNFIIGEVVNTFEPCGSIMRYKTGLGRVYWYQCEGPLPNANFKEELTHYHKNGFNCNGYPSLEVDKLSKRPEITFYPNPASDILNIELALTDEIQTATIFNSIGAAVARATFVAKETFNVSDLPAGIYFINIQSKDGSSLKEKIVIQR